MKLPKKVKLWDDERSVGNSLCDAIAQEWMTAGGKNNPSAIDALLRVDSPSGHAAECIEAWGLQSAAYGCGAEQPKTWLAQRDATPADVIAAFERFVSERPDRPGLPHTCYAVRPGAPRGKRIIRVIRGEEGYFQTDLDSLELSDEAVQACVDLMNDRVNVNKPTASAMLHGSLFGWHTPGADPANAINQQAR